jgi:hypothetical protein
MATAFALVGTFLCLCRAAAGHLPDKSRHGISYVKQHAGSVRAVADNLIQRIPALL